MSRKRVLPGMRFWMALACVSLAAAPGAAGNAEDRTPASGPDSQSFSASVLALRDARVPAEVAGRVIRRLDDESTVVKEGDPVVWLDDVLLKAALRTAEAELRQAEANRDWAKLELGRLRILKERGSIEAEAYDRAEVASRRTVAAVEAASARVEETRTRLERAVIRAPFAGKLVRIHPQEGEYLRPGDVAFRVLDDSALRIVAYVPASALPALAPGGMLELRSDVKGVGPLRARIHSVASGTEGATRRFRVEARAKDPKGKWRPGMTALARAAAAGAGSKER